MLLTCLIAPGTGWGQAAKSPGPDLTKQPTLYVVGYAHLDTQWRWEYPTTISQYILNTMRDNFALFEKYPHYIFNFSGANRYRMMKEYFPADYAKVKKYVDAGRWFPAGSSVEENDVNSPSAESIIRQVLYGKLYFRREFDKTSAEYMLPDCFGFPASLPSILAHAGIRGFSTQKLTWGSSAPAGGPNSPEKTPLGTPFNVGIWEGPDGKSVIAALNPGSYSASITTDLSATPGPPPPPDPSLTPQQRQAYEQRMRQREDWPARVRLDGEVSGLFTDYHYYGTGDIGGSPTEASVKLMEAIVTKGKTVLPAGFGRGAQGQSQPPPPGPDVQVGEGPLHVLSATADQMFLDIKPSQMAKLPRYKGELELTNHSAGSLTSETYLKRWNRKNELLADAAEKASVAAELLGGRPYPLERLNDAWTLVMGGQFHDITPGTSTPKAYEFSWNDEVLAMNQFAGVMASATEAVAAGMDTQVKGTPIVVYNPLNIAREDVVEASVSFPNGAPQAVRVTGPDGKPVPAQVSGGKVLFLAKAPSVGYAVYDVEPAETAAASSTLKVSESSLENARYRVTIDQNGDIAGIFDKTLKKDLLLTPARLEIKTDKPMQWPAWNMDWEDQSRAPRAYVGGPAQVRIVESGPARVAVEVSRETEGSRFVETIRLSAGDAGNRLEVGNVIDWNTKESHLKAVFPLAATNAVATYNWDIGAIQRGTDNPKKFEVPSHQWVDLTDQTGAYGATVLTDCKNASDKPDDNTLRLTLIRTPGTRGQYDDQGTQDLGHHEFVYGLAGHFGDWRKGQTDWQAYRLNQPLIAFEASRHAGALGKTFSLLSVSHSRVRVLALKKAEQSDEVIVRLVELDGKPASDVQIAFAAPVTAAREVNGAEEAVGAATVTGGKLVTSFTAFQPRTFAVKLGAAPAKVVAVHSQPVKLAYDLAAASNDETRSAGGFAADGRALPAEMLPAELAFGGVKFNLAPAKTGTPNAVVARGQTVPLPAGKFNRVYVLAASADGDQKATFRVGEKAVEVNVQDWGGFIGQWDDRIWKSKEVPIPPRPGAPAGTATRTRTDPYGEMTGLKPGFIKRADVAWFASHRHTADGANEPYAYSYLFAYPLDVPAGASALTLPNNQKIRILAISVAEEGATAKPVQPLYDTLER
ncbi:MAG: glycoside hydrolase family 38 C-terminal domain-containing protein [Bryobacteraceae bacterium]|jgi:alpha-mannosidase